MKRSNRPRVCWLVEHLADVVLFGFTTPVSLLALWWHFL